VVLPIWCPRSVPLFKEKKKKKPEFPLKVEFDEPSFSYIIIFVSLKRFGKK
jgi:hypothetical protein